MKSETSEVINSMQEHDPEKTVHPETAKKGPAPTLSREKVVSALRRNRGFKCLECGKCTAVCPVSIFNSGYSPRRVMNSFLTGHSGKVLSDETLWECLTCGLCNLRCPSDVDFACLMKDIRIEAVQQGAEIPASHCGFLHSMMKTMASPNLSQKRTEWITKDLKVAEKGDILYFVGCLPYFDAYFTDINVETIPIAKGAVKLLNRLGIEPVVMKDERCCGHDLLWSGDEAHFKKLAELNAEAIRKTGAKTVLTTCAECAHTLKSDFPAAVGDMGVEIQHITEFLAARMDSGDLRLGPLDKTVTFHDPCRLGRFMNIYDPPREVIKNIPELTFKEMFRSLHRAACCGTNSWINCNAVSKRLQENRLKEARSTGAEVLITACPKCYIHFKCAMSGSELRDSLHLEVEDITTLAASAVETEKS